ncbi:plasmid mobilization protein [Pedobacter psychrodurus]|uniref:plasmid mobilization protein n=1 Tax=Pedobacter psychrodurus TaxID=2530456 RepID=UPI0029307D6D|nr:hypothetical protein [Pedobacter psychrodurus]
MKKPYKENELRNRKAICCLTDEEYREIKKDITKLGVTMSEYLRQILFDKRAHLLLDSAQLVKWMDQIAIESRSSILAIHRFAQNPFEGTHDCCHADELRNLIDKCISSQHNIGRCMRKLIKVINNN